jgi:ADP-dependent NAD(P)H-hydrate dehydratase / NAD(P)H-hydrate epimerase
VRDAYSVEKIRVAEAALMAKLPEGTLMRRAAGGLAAVCAGLLRSSPGVGGVYGARVVVLAGSGDNGGDALYAGATLARRGAAVTAIVAGPRAHSGGLAALRAAGGQSLVTQAGDSTPEDSTGVRHAIGHADLILDGLLGIGGKGGLREPYATLAKYAANSAGVTVAVDLPSGIDADTGAVDGPCVVADVTVSFGGLKPGLLVDPGARNAGVVELVDIGLGPYLPRPDVRAPALTDIADLVPRPGPESDKYRRGVVGLLAGSDRYTGAAVLATGGAVRGGAGMVRLVTGPKAADMVRPRWPEVVITPLSPELEFPAEVGRVQAWVAGPGMGVDDGAAERLAAVLRTSLPVLVDADGLTLLSRRPDLLPRHAPTLLTPHAGELGRLLGADPVEVEARRVFYAREAARRFGACVLLKGSTTVVAQPEPAPVLVNTTGTPWLATAGTGDVLSGLAGALLAQGLLPPQAAITAAYLHGLAARLAAGGDAGRDAATGAEAVAAGEAPIGASAVVEALPHAFRAL